METRIFRQLFLWILVWFVVLGVVIALLVHLEMGTEGGIVAKYLGPQPGATSGDLNREYLFWIAMAVVLALIGFFQWFSMRFSMKRILAEFKVPAVLPPLEKRQEKTEVSKPASPAKKTDVQDDQRRSLHLLCLLQREGRLVDFLKEDLKDYEDAQIGAAVRNIQENCQKSLNEYLSLKAVVDQEEGETVTIQPGFDASAIKLTGKVTGKPPFKGILQHRGWRVTNFALPQLSGAQNPNIVAPAEVEIE